MAWPACRARPISGALARAAERSRAVLSGKVVATTSGPPSPLATTARSAPLTRLAAATDWLVMAYPVTRKPSRVNCCRTGTATA